MKKLAGTNWGANSKIIKQIYTGYVRPVMEYGSATWSTAYKSNTQAQHRTKHNKTQECASLQEDSRSIAALETTTKLAPLDERREGKILTYHAKIQRMPSLTAHNILQARTKNKKVKLQPHFKTASQSTLRCTPRHTQSL